MVLLPIVGRELRVAARRRSAFWYRLLAAAVASAAGGFSLWLTADWTSSGAAGARLFEFLTVAALALCLAAGPVFTADLLSEEKREGTLGLLFLTDLHGYDVILGKLAGAAIPALFSLLAALPVIALPLLLGGVSLPQLGLVAAALCNLLFFSLAVGMLTSACCWSARTALGAAILVLIVCLVEGFWSVRVTVVGQRPDWFLYSLYLLDPLRSFRLTQTFTNSFSMVEWFSALVITHLVAWGLLAISSLILVRRWQDSVSSGGWAAGGGRWGTWTFGEAGQRRALRERLLALNPVLWMCSRNSLKRRVLTRIVAVWVTAWFGLALIGGRDFRSWPLVMVMAFLFQVAMKWLLAAEATQRWAEDRRSGALELLITTPLEVREIIRGQMHALCRLFGPPALLLLATELVLFILGASATNPQEREVGGLAAAFMIVFVADLITIAWAGSWLGLVKVRPIRAYAGVLMRVLVLPWLLSIAVYLSICAASDNVSTVTSNDNIFTITYAVVALLVDVVLCFVARSRLTHRFREQAAQVAGR